MGKIRTVLFDLDGTLADTALDLAAAVNYLRDQQGLPPLPYEALRPVASHGTKAMLRRGLGLTPESDEYEDYRDRFLERYFSHICDETRLFPGMEDVIDSVEQRGYNWGVVTNKPSRLTDPLMVELGLSERAMTIVSSDTCGHAKPHPAPMRYAAKQCESAPEECLYIGDAARDIEAGRVVDMPTLVALWGYLDPDEDYPEDWGADGMIEQPSNILDWLDKH